jgi:hypothetical protein
MKNIIKKTKTVNGLKKLLSIKNIVRAVVLIPTLMLVFYCVHYSIKHSILKPMLTTYKDCGIIKSKGNDEVSIKHRTRTDLYLNVQFDKTGFKSILVEPTLYFYYKIGDRACFELHNEVNKQHVTIIVIGWVIMIILGIILLACLFTYIFTE